MTIREIFTESICAKQPHMFPQYFSWGWIDPEGKIICPTDTDKQHTSILRRLSDQYGLPEDTSEYQATRKGWIRWLVEYNQKEKQFTLFFNTITLSKTPEIYNSILSIVSDNTDATFFSFMYSNSKWIQSLGKDDFISQLRVLFDLPKSKKMKTADHRKPKIGKNFKKRERS